MNQARSTPAAESAGVHLPPPPAGAHHIGERPGGRSATPGAATLEVEDVIEARPVGSFPVRVLLLCAAVLFVVGYDTQAFAYVAPAVTRDLGLGHASLRNVFVSGQLGLILGALLIGPLADRIGRKRVILISTIAFGVLTLVTAAARDGSTFLALRFLTGLGLGGTIPSAIALTADFSSDRRRASIVMAMLCGLSVGAASGGVIAAALIRLFGWPPVFLVGGVLTLVLVPVLAVSLPEASGLHEGRVPGTRIAQLFGAGRGAVTLWFCAILFMGSVGLSVLSSSLPLVLTNSLHAAPSTVALILGLLSVGGVAGALALGPFIDRRSFRALWLTYLGAAVSVAAIGYAEYSTFASAVAVSCAGFCLLGGEIAVSALAANYYPTPIRSTGVGWVLGMGRVGLILGSLIFGALLSSVPAVELLFVEAAVPVAGASLAAFAIARVTAAAHRTESRGVATVG